MYLYIRYEHLIVHKICLEILFLFILLLVIINIIEVYGI